MEIIKQGSGEGVVWLKCPNCQGFLPYMTDEEPTSAPADTSDNAAVAIEDLDVDNAKEYSEFEEYDVGDVIHHRSWNDYGKIVAKETLPGNRKIILAQFLRQGKVKLLEGVIQ